MKHQRFLLTSITLLFLIGFLSVPVASAQKIQVRAILFYSQNCGHCHKVITEVLPPLSEKYGDQLQIGGVDVGHQIGQQLYQSAIERFEIPENRLGVPTLIIGETVLVGSLEIPEELPGLIEEGLENGGIDWPDIPGLKEIIAEQSVSTQEVQDSEVQGNNQNPEATHLEKSTPKTAVFIDRFKQDPIGNSFSVIILFGMIATLLVVGYSSIKGEKSDIIDWPNWVIPVVSIIGLVVASYLSYVEITASTAICGPVGDCNTVQESAYAHLFGVLPIGVLGVLGYIAIMTAWFFQYYGPEKFRRLFSLSLWGMAWFGVLFSIYLTFLEPFVIGATCAWCLTSAIIMTIILIASTEPAKQVLQIDDSEYDDEFLIAQREITG